VAHAAGRAWAAFHDSWDVLLCPVMAVPPTAHGAWDLTPIESLQMSLLRRIGTGRLIKLALVEFADKAFDKAPNTMMFNLTGQPAISVPLCWNAAGLPIGAHLSAAFGNDGLLFRLAAQLEQARPWADRRPPISA
jgi:amidase